MIPVTPERLTETDVLSSLPRRRPRGPLRDAPTRSAGGGGVGVGGQEVVAVRHPSSAFGPPLASIAYTHTVCAPAAAGTRTSNPWFGPRA
jgi:hypothetical protein